MAQLVDGPGRNCPKCCARMKGTGAHFGVLGGKEKEEGHRLLISHYTVHRDTYSLWQ
jgi:hypothetical protein